MTDNVNHPPHYTKHPSGIECIQITEHMSFCIGNAIKYLWRADHKLNSKEDFKKAIWYIEREIERRENNPDLFPFYGLQSLHETTQDLMNEAKVKDHLIFGDGNNQYRKVEITKLGESNE